MLIDHGGSIIIRNTNAPRARTPSSSPTTASTPGAYPVAWLISAENDIDPRPDVAVDVHGREYL
jgi:hypothetical protein